MKTDSDAYRSIANQIQSQITYCFLFKKPIQTYRHNVIQDKLSQLSNYFSQSANSIDTNESLLMNYSTGSISAIETSNIKDGRLTTNYSSLINWDSIFNKGNRKSSVSMNLQYALKEATFFNIQSQYFRSKINMNIGDIQATGNVKFSLWEDKNFSPDVTMVGTLEGSLFSANASARLGTSNIYAKADAKGTVGTVYANAKAILNMEEQTLDLGVGVAGAKGEVSCCFNVFGYKITITGEGSIGSAEASISYSHKNREWEFGSKLGFIAGLGFKVNVNY